MSLIFDEFVVIDLEAACWMGPPPPGMENEIIEIGVCVVDMVNLTIKSSESIIVKPKYSEISSFCTKLTSITPEEALKGVSFKNACRLLEEKYQARRKPWGSWGSFDVDKFKEQCKKRRVDYPLGNTHIDIKNLFTVFFRLKHEPGLKNALKLLNMPLEGRHHRGVDDAVNCARLLIEVLKHRPAQSLSDVS